MSDWGIKVSQPGEDVFGPDQRLIFSSSWKIINVIDQVSFQSVPEGGTIYNHGLDYPPLFLPFTNQRFQGAAAGVCSFNHTFGGRVVTDNTRIKVLNEGSSKTATGTVMITDINLQVDYEAPSINVENTSKSGTIDRNNGVKVSLPGKSVHSEDMRDFAIHSGTRTPMIHRIKNFDLPGGWNNHVVQHDLGYSPMFIVYVDVSGLDGWQVVGSAGDAFVRSTSTQVIVDIGHQGKMAVVVLKDPLEIA